MGGVYEGRRRLAKLDVRSAAVGLPCGALRLLRSRWLPARGRQLRDLRRQAGGVALEHQQPDLREHRLDRFARQRLALREQNLLGGGLASTLVAVEQLLVKLLAGPAPDDLDVDVPVGVQTRQVD